MNMRKAIVYLCLALFLAFVIEPNVNVSLKSGTSRVPTQTKGTPTTNETVDLKKSKSKATICIDPDHGGDDEGYTSDTTESEKELCLDIAKALGDQLYDVGYEVMYTREDNDTDVADSARISAAEEGKADYIISISLNHDDDIYDKGYSIFTQNNDKAIELSQAISNQLQDLNYSQFLGLDTDHYDNFDILSNEDIPAVLLDLGYLTNSEDYTKISSSSYQKTLARAITKGVLESVN